MNFPVLTARPSTVEFFIKLKTIGGVPVVVTDNLASLNARTVKAGSGRIILGKAYSCEKRK